jgi:hypothetical protein
MLVGVCDFPSQYAFRPRSYGGIERWLWALAVGRRAAGADVHLLEPQWRTELAEKWTLHLTRTNTVAGPRVDAHAGDFAADHAHVAGEVAGDVQEIGLARFDPARHSRALATRPC